MTALDKKINELRKNIYFKSHTVEYVKNILTVRLQGCVHDNYETDVEYIRNKFGRKFLNPGKFESLVGKPFELSFTLDNSEANSFITFASLKDFFIKSILIVLGLLIIIALYSKYKSK